MFTGYIEEFCVRDCTLGEDFAFSNYEEAETYLHKRRLDYPNNAIIFNAVIDGG
jgi:hypothetical protein